MLAGTNGFLGWCGCVVLWFSLSTANSWPAAGSGFQVLLSNNEYSYLEANLNGVEEQMFPAKLEISLTLGFMRGLLLYSADKNRNQIALELDDITDPILSLYFRNIRAKQVELRNLCGCEKNCQYETINLTLEMRSRLLIRCNNRSPRTFPYSRRVTPLKDFPQITFKKSEKNAAKVWLVNHPKIGNAAPCPNQMVGCIHAVRYQNRDLTLSTKGPRIRRGCRDACTEPKICNMGHCVGTLDDDPVCDCTAALLMGKTCNDKLNTDSTKTAVFKIRFSSLKVSWSGGTNHRILLLQLSNLNITLYSLNDELRLQQKYHTNSGPTNSTKVLLHKYDSRHSHTAIIQFLGTRISIQTPLDNNISSLFLLVHSPETERSQEVKLTLYSLSEGASDAAIKNSDFHYQWTKISWIQDPLSSQRAFSSVKSGTVLMRLL